MPREHAEPYGETRAHTKAPLPTSPTSPRRPFAHASADSAHVPSRLAHRRRHNVPCAPSPGLFRHADPAPYLFGDSVRSGLPQSRLFPALSDRFPEKIRPHQFFMPLRANRRDHAAPMRPHRKAPRSRDFAPNATENPFGASFAAAHPCFPDLQGFPSRSDAIGAPAMIA